MPNFWSFISNEKYSVACTGQMVYLYDKNGTELAKFKDLIYAFEVNNPKSLFTPSVKANALPVLSKIERKAEN